jgi:hypothetical protein
VAIAAGYTALSSTFMNGSESSRITESKTQFQGWIDCTFDAEAMVHVLSWEMVLMLALAASKTQSLVLANCGPSKY